MQITNHSPFPCLLFLAEDQDGDEHDILVVKGTFVIGPDEATIAAKTQDPIRLIDEYNGEPGSSSLIWESDLTPHKSKTDIIVRGNAVAPGQVPHKSWKVELKLASMKNSLRVYGPRKWRKEKGAWQLSEAEEVSIVPLQYELSLGSATEASCDWNPVGSGWIPEQGSEQVEEVIAHQIEMFEEPISSPFDAGLVAGIGPIGKSWEPRLSLVSGFDQEWRENRWPSLPDQFDFQFFNGANPEMIVPHHYVDGERFQIDGMTASGELSFQIPHWRFQVEVTDSDQYQSSIGMILDTVEVDVEAMICRCTWRGSHLKQAELIQLDLYAEALETTHGK